ncbi:unnamed protein product [Eruca vesicaria subsp. sativa]|uniref:Replication factor A C-terminal domain-containing protein n=1 Tax=Eruca vesicaria subsp. sativa TaxID=29727 RepID=A0ABC8JII0_ERUVS|nr:unnamed protein product [Eruca vesicaria subsp. sativa]
MLYLTLFFLYMYRLVARDNGLPPAAPLLRGYAKVEPITIAELNSFIMTSPSRVIDFICTGQVTHIDVEKGWCYVACSVCAKKLERIVSSFTCRECDTSHAVGSLRYRVEMSISDNSGEGVFVCFDGVMSKLLSLKAADVAQMLAADDVNPEETQLPEIIGDMAGKIYTFQVRVSAYNFTPNHKTFTITRIISEGERVPQPDFCNNGGNNGEGDNNTGGEVGPVNVEIGASTSKTDPHVAGTYTDDAPEQLGSSSLEVVKKARIA